MIAFSIFWRPIYRYWIFYFISFILGYIFLYFIGKKWYFSKYPTLSQVFTKNLDSLIIFLILWLLIWWRLGYILIYNFDYYLHHLSEVLQVWKGWMSFIGGGVWVITSMLIFKKRQKLSRKEFLLLFDCIFVMVPIGIFRWRLGNYLNQELYWVVFHNPWLSQDIVNILMKTGFLHTYSNVDQQLRRNTNLLSMLFEWILLFVIGFDVFKNQIKRQTFFAGLITGCFLVWYSLIRFLLEYLRNDSQSQFILFFTKSQRVFVGSFIIWFILLISILKKNRTWGIFKSKKDVLTQN